MTQKHPASGRIAFVSRLAVLLLVGASSSRATGQAVSCVIHISVDGLRPDAVTALGASNLPNFYRLRTQGAFTDNARTDYDYTITLPNHTCQLTGYHVTGTNGHNWTYNEDTSPDVTIAFNKGRYVAGVFDVAHDHGLRTGLYASKTKFSIYLQSWDATNGAPDLVPPDSGRNKIDVSNLCLDTTVLVNALVTNATAQPFNYVFLHLADPDLNGHLYGWDITPGTPYSNAVKLMDTHLETLFAMIDGIEQLSNHTAIILTADHGGSGRSHLEPSLPAHYTVPLYVWGPTVTPGADLYAINPRSRKNPGMARPDCTEVPQPIRNGDAANLALMLLGLSSVPGSVINTSQNLSVTAPFNEGFRLSLIDGNEVFTFSTRSNVLYDIESTTNLTLGAWRVIASNIPGNGGKVTNLLSRPVGHDQEFFRLHSHP